MTTIINVLKTSCRTIKKRIVPALDTRNDNIKTWSLVLFIFYISGCSVGGISLNSMYMKKNYNQVIQYAGKYKELDDYGVLSICKSLLKVQKYSDFNKCYSELITRANKQKGVITDITGDTLSKSLTAAIFAAMQAEYEMGLGNYAEAIDHAEKSLKQLNAEKNTLKTVSDLAKTSEDVVNVLLVSYSILKNKVKTLEVISQANDLNKYKIFGTPLVKDYRILPMVARAYYELGMYHESLKYSKLVIKKLNNLGAFESAFFTVMTSFDTAVTGSKTADGKATTFEDMKFVGLLESRAIKARSELEIGEYDKALTGFNEILSSQLIAGITSIYYPVLHDRGRVSEELGQYAEAEKYYRQSVDVIEYSRSSIKSDSHKIAYVGNKQKVYASLVRVLYKQNKTARAFEAVERAKARALIDLLASKSGVTFPSNRVSLTGQSLAKDLQIAEAKIANKFITDRVKTLNLDRELIRHKKNKLIKAAPEYASLITVTPPSKSGIQLLLPKNELLLEYYAAGEDIYIFAVTNKEINVTLVKSKLMHNMVKKFRSLLYDVNSEKYKVVSVTLYNKLIKPVASIIKQAKGVTIVPHGVLHYLPFDALYSGKYYLLDHKAIRMLPSATVMKFLNNKTHSNNAMLVLGNPDLGDKEFDLEGAQKEAIAISKNIPDAQLLLRKKATETAIKTKGRNYKYLHFASHGVFDPEKPLSSSLLLAEDSENDGIFSVSELYSLSLNADLVTLSACETALGKVANGDDVIGFTRGFLYSGAKSIVSSLWKVDDSATSQLMQSFYINLMTMNKRSALRQAQLKVKSQYDHPYFWAAFQLTGAVN